MLPGHRLYQDVNENNVTDVVPAQWRSVNITYIVRLDVDIGMLPRRLLEQHTWCCSQWHPSNIPDIVRIDVTLTLGFYRDVTENNNAYVVLSEFMWHQDVTETSKKKHTCCCFQWRPGNISDVVRIDVTLTAIVDNISVFYNTN